MRGLKDASAWSPDRLHLAAEGHRRVALRTCEVLGVPVTGDWRGRLPLPAERAPGGRRRTGPLAGCTPPGRALGRSSAPVAAPAAGRHPQR